MNMVLLFLERKFFVFYFERKSIFKNKHKLYLLIVPFALIVRTDDCWNPHVLFRENIFLQYAYSNVIQHFNREQPCQPKQLYVFYIGVIVHEFDCLYITVDGVWTGWTGWNACSASCTPYGTASTSGTETRTRSCTDPAPKYDGLQCSGAAAETLSCSSSTVCPSKNKLIHLLRIKQNMYTH